MDLDRDLMFEEFCEEHDYCWSCGWDAHSGIHKWHVPRLETHHVLRGAERVQDRRNLARLCAGCHRLAHGDRIRNSRGNYFPVLKLANILWLKRKHDRDHFDPLWFDLHTALLIPHIERPDPWFDEEYRRHRRIPSWR